MLKYFIQKAVGKSFFGRRPRISVCVPSGVTDVEKRAVEDATYQRVPEMSISLRSRLQPQSEPVLTFPDHAEI